MYTLLIEDLTRDCNTMKTALSRFCDKMQVTLNEKTPDSKNKQVIQTVEEYDLLRALNIAHGWFGAYDNMLCKLQRLQKDYIAGISK